MLANSGKSLCKTLKDKSSIVLPNRSTLLFFQLLSSAKTWSVNTVQHSHFIQSKVKSKFRTYCNVEVCAKPVRIIHLLTSYETECKDQPGCTDYLNRDQQFCQFASLVF